ncbi:MAG TPA: hypothetical protein VFZ31_16320 [Vicinamibacterales bacterium]
MRSRHSARAGVLAIALLLALPAGDSWAQEPVAASGDQIAREDVAAALAEVQRDPNLGGQSTMKMLRWKSSGRQQSKTDLGWVRWIGGFFGWMGQSARYLIWITIALLAGWLVVYLVRAFQNSGANSTAADTFVPPTHVRNLDIRPESLPPNIGAAARKMWERGDHRAALSLLYRGLLSRLSHVHRVPILDSSTEGDCLLLLPGRVPAKTSDYATQLVDAWRGFVYGGTAAATPTIHALCDGFSAALDRSAARPAEGGRA